MEVGGVGAGAAVPIGVVARLCVCFGVSVSVAAGVIIGASGMNSVSASNTSRSSVGVVVGAGRGCRGQYEDGYSSRLCLRLC